MSTLAEAARLRRRQGAARERKRPGRRHFTVSKVSEQMHWELEDARSLPGRPQHLIDHDPRISDGLLHGVRDLRTLDEKLAEICRALATAGEVACPVCGGSMVVDALNGDVQETGSYCLDCESSLV